MGTPEELNLRVIFRDHIEPRNTALKVEAEKDIYKDSAGKFSQEMWDNRWRRTDGSVMDRTQIFRHIMEDEV